MKRFPLALILVLFSIFALVSCDAQTAVDGELLSFSQPPGIYTERFTLNVACSDPSLEIRYTTNSALPTVKSELYTEEEGIAIRYRGGGGTDPASVNVIRCAAFDKDGNQVGKTLTGSFLITDTPNLRYSTLVISLVGEPSELYGHVRGIMVAGKINEDFRKYGRPSYWTNKSLEDANYFQTGIEWERAVNMEVFDTDGSLMLSQGVGARVSGGWNRGNSHKSLRLFARYIYDDANVIELDAYPGLLSTTDVPVTAHKTLLLRTGSNNIWNNQIQTQFLMQLAEDAGLDSMHYRPVCVYLNGQYYGYLAMLEDYSTAYFENHFNIPAEEITCINGAGYISGGVDWMLDNGPETELDEYLKMMNYIIDSDMTKSENYKKASEMLDIDNFVRYMCFEGYIANSDWPRNNVRVWRRFTDGYNPDAEVYGYDGRWRYVLKDLDTAAGFSGDSIDASVFHRLNSDDEELRLNAVFKSLFHNKDFQNRVYCCLSDYMSTTMQVDHVMSALGEVLLSSQLEMRYYLPSYKLSGSTLTKWYSYMQKPRDFFVTRIGNVHKELAEMTDSQWNTLSVKIEGEGTVNLSTFELDADIELEYLSGLQIPVTTEAATGWRLASLSLDHNEITEDSFTMPSDNAELTIVFEPDEDYIPFSGVRLNEVKYEYAMNDPSCDMVELYNNSDETIYLKGYSLQKDGLRADGTEDTDRWSFPAASIGAGEYLTIYFDRDGVTTGREIFRTSFGLGAGDTLTLLDRNGDPLDSVELVTCSNQATLARDDDGW